MGFNGDLYPTAGASVVMTTSGDMVKYQSGARARLGIGSANQILQVKSSLPSWETVDLADTVLTTAGDVLYENSTPELARLPKGSDADVLTLASGLPSWSAPSSGGATGNYMGADHTATAHTTLLFAALGFGNNNKYAATESDVTIPVHMSFTLIRGTYNVQFNSANATAVLAFRDDGVNKADVTTVVSQTGAYDTGAISEAIASGSECNWVLDASSITGGELGVTPYMVLYD